MLFFPGEIVVIVDLFQDLRSQNGSDLFADPIPARVGIAARQLHARHVFGPQFGLHVQQHRIHVHPVPAAPGLDEVSGQLVAQTAGPEVHSDPDPLPLVGEEVDIVVAAADGAQLFSGDRFQTLRHRNLPGRIVVEEVVVDGLPG